MTAKLDLLVVTLDVEEDADDERRVVLEVELSTGQSDLELGNLNALILPSSVVVSRIGAQAWRLARL